MSAPASHAVMISVGVKAPGTDGISWCDARLITCGDVFGATMKRAPASTAWSTASAVRTVPAPMTILDPRARASALIMSSAPAVFSVTSTTSTPPARSASAASTANEASVWRMIATTPFAVMRPTIALRAAESRVMSVPSRFQNEQYAILLTDVDQADDLSTP